MTLYIGIDLGTSGCRAAAIDDGERLVAEHQVALPPPERASDSSEQTPQVWWEAVLAVLGGLLGKIDGREVRALAVDGTSGTLLLTDSDGRPLTPGLMYDDARAKREAERIAAVAPQDAVVRSPTSGLAKLLHLAATVEPHRHFLALHQADWILGRLTGRYGVSDINNALKLGYDPVIDRWPDWLDALDIDPRWLPEVVPVGALVGTLAPDVAKSLGMPDSVRVMAGTTDSTASVIAAGARRAGDAVTVLGSTLVIKIVTTRPVTASSYGVYSHRFGDLWLAGGASNSGGAVLANYFDTEELRSLESELKPEQATGLDYYPLLRPGERFPVSDPQLQPRLSPQPPEPVRFLQGMLEGMAAIEAAGYQRLAELGCPRPTRAITIGGGASNDAWRRIREQRLDIPVTRAAHQEAAYGTALIARRGRVPEG